MTASLSVTATEINNRRDSIKSHGVLIETDSTNEVLFDASDLYLLADEIDELESWYREAVKQAWNDGYAAHLPGDAKIKYVYHKHKTNSGTTSDSTIYSLNAPGGCYTVGSHTHNATGTCSSKQEKYTETVREKTGVCGCTHNHEEYASCGHGQHWPNACTADVYTTKEVTKTRTVYTCGSPKNTWNIGCGKTTSTIEEAHIIYDN